MRSPKHSTIVGTTSIRGMSVPARQRREIQPESLCTARPGLPGPPKVMVPVASAMAVVSPMSLCQVANPALHIYPPPPGCGLCQVMQAYSRTPKMNDTLPFVTLTGRLLIGFPGYYRCSGRFSCKLLQNSVLTEISKIVVKFDRELNLKHNTIHEWL